MTGGFVLPEVTLSDAPSRRAVQARPGRATSPAQVALPCPYPGMRPYAADDAHHFHGRGAEIDELIGRLRAGERELHVIGPSGFRKVVAGRGGFGALEP